MTEKDDVFAQLDKALAAAQRYDLEHRPRMENWGRVGDDQVLRLLRGAAPHLAKLPAGALVETPGRPVYVLAVGHDLGPDDAERIQHAVVEALRSRD